MTTIYKLKEINQNFILFFPIFFRKTFKNEENDPPLIENRSL